MKPDMLLEAKLQQPRPVRGYVERTALRERLACCKEKLIVFHANMGFGKTLFMSEYARESGSPCLWYHLDRQDNDCLVFLRYLQAGIRQIFNKEPSDSIKIEDGQSAAAVLDQLCGDGTLLLMLDDFQVIENEDICELLDVILKHTGDGVRLFLTTKGILPRFVNRYVLERQAVIVGSGDLAFSREETCRLLASGRTAPLDEEVADAVWRYTEGWCAGVMFFHLYQQQGRISVSREQMLNICQEYMVHDYIMYELFRKLPFDLQEFLKKTSVLEYLDSEICNAVAQVKNASGQLKYLVLENMFIQKTEGSLSVYRYHSLFRDFLKSQLTMGEQDMLYERAALFCMKNGQPEQALEYGMLSHSVPLTETVLERSGFALLGQGRHMQLREALAWCRGDGRRLCAANQVLELLLGLSADRNPVDGADEVCTFLRKFDGSPGADGHLHQRLVTMAVELACGRGLDGGGDRILEAAMEWEGLSLERRYEYLAARICLNVRMGRTRQAKRLWGSMTDGRSRGGGAAPVSETAKWRIRRIRQIAVELADVWELPETDAGDTVDAGGRDRGWWFAEEERRLLAQLRSFRQMCQRIAGEMEEVRAAEVSVDVICGETPGNAAVSRNVICDEDLGSVAVSGDVICGEASGNTAVFADLSAGAPGWMEAVLQILGGLSRFRDGQREEGCRMAAEGMKVLESYPWLTLPILAAADRRTLLWMWMLSEADAASDEHCHIFLQCFGTFRVTVMETGEEIRFRTSRARECMAYLYYKKQPVTREQILSALWEDADQLPANEVAALHNIFSTIRKSLSPWGLEDVLCYEDKKYGLREGVVFSDIDLMERFLQAAVAGESSGLLRAAGVCELYGGSYLQDLGNSWCAADRAHYDSRFCGALTALAEVYQQEQEFAAALAILEKAEALDGLREDISLRILDCCIALDDGSRLKACYRRIKKHWRELTGGEPGEAVRQRYLEGIKRCERL